MEARAGDAPDRSALLLDSDSKHVLSHFRREATAFLKADSIPPPPRRSVRTLSPDPGTSFDEKVPYWKPLPSTVREFLVTSLFLKFDF